MPWFKRRWGGSANFVVRVPVPFRRLYWHGDANHTVRATTYRVTAVLKYCCYAVAGGWYSFKTLMMTCTLDLYTDYLLSSTGPTTATGLSRLLDGALSHDHITRWLSQGTYGPAEVWRQAKPLIRPAEARRPGDEFAVLIVDDSVLKKAHTDANELICNHWDHSQQRYVKGLNFVSLRYQAGALAVPIAVELVRKTVPIYIYQPKTGKTSYQSPFTKNEYL